MPVYKNLIVPGSKQRPMGVDLFLPEGPGPFDCVVYLHGFNGFKDWGNFDLIAEEFVKQGFAFLKFNFSHNGTTPESPETFVDLEAFGHNNFSKELFDVQCILGWMRDERNKFNSFINLQKISIIGHSRGGGIALLSAAADSEIHRLILWASVSACQTPFGMYAPERLMKWKEDGVIHYHNQRTNQKMPLYYQLYEDYIQHQEEYHLDTAMKGLKIPVLICHGTKDLAVPLEHAERLHSWKPDADYFIVESDHVFGRKHPWVDENLPHAMQRVVDESIRFLKRNA